MTTTLPITVCAEIAAQLSGWFKERGGVIAWPSHDLSFNPGQLTFTPLRTAEGTSNEGKPPTWRHSATDFTVVTDPSQIVLLPGIEIERTKIYLKLRGMKIELTAASSRRVRSKLAKLKESHPKAWYEFDPPQGSIPFEGQDVFAVFFKPGAEVTLKEWGGL